MKSLMGLITANYISGNFSVLTEERPEASLPFGGRYRLIDFPLSNMVNSGITTVGLVTPYENRSLMDHVGVGKEWALNRKVGGLFILPGSTYGLKGARGKFVVRDLIQNRPFIEKGGCKHIIITDSAHIMNIDYSAVEEFHTESGNDITVLYKKGIRTTEKNQVYLNLNANGMVKQFVYGQNDDFNCMIGAFIMNVDLLFNILDLYEHMRYMDLLEIFNDHIDQFKIGSYAFTGYVGLINGLHSYMHSSMDLLKPEVSRQLFSNDAPVRTKVSDAPPVKYVKGSDVSASLVSSGCIIEGTVENSILFRDVHIAKGAVVRNCVLMQHCVVSEGAIIENIICDKYVNIKPGMQISANPESPIALNKKEIL